MRLIQFKPVASSPPWVLGSSNRAEKKEGKQENRRSVGMQGDPERSARRLRSCGRHGKGEGLVPGGRVQDRHPRAVRPPCSFKTRLD